MVVSISLPADIFSIRFHPLDVELFSDSMDVVRSHHGEQLESIRDHIHPDTIITSQTTLSSQIWQTIKIDA